MTIEKMMTGSTQKFEQYSFIRYIKPSEKSRRKIQAEVHTYELIMYIKGQPSGHSRYQGAYRKEMGNSKRATNCTGECKTHNHLRNSDKLSSRPWVQKINWEGKETVPPGGNTGSLGGNVCNQVSGNKPADCMHNMGRHHAAKSHMGRHLEHGLYNHIRFTIKAVYDVLPRPTDLHK